VLTLLLAWGAAFIANKSATYKHTYGFRRGTVLSALLSSLLLLGALGAITLEAFQRLFNPAPVNGAVMIAVAGVGVIINTATALLFMKGQHSDLNVRGAFLHMAQDAALSFGVVVAGIAIHFTGWRWLDPLTSLVIVALVFWSTWQLFRESLNLSIDAVPEHIDIHAVETYLRSAPGVVEVHDLHVWALSTSEVALTAHLVLGGDFVQGDDWLREILQQLRDSFGIRHATIQVERSALTCEQAECC
jgi:cobalt-zinc-cadmium efflux system protein